jgi:hypothetical protein
MGILDYDRDWMHTQATVESVKRKFLPQTFGDGGYVTEYVVTFSYDVGGRKWTGKHTTSTPPEIGHKFEILYDPKHPNRNSGIDHAMNPWVKWVIRLLLLGVFLTAYWPWGDQDWFGRPGRPY